ATKLRARPATAGPRARDGCGADYPPDEFTTPPPSILPGRRAVPKPRFDSWVLDPAPFAWGSFAWRLQPLEGGPDDRPYPPTRPAGNRASSVPRHSGRGGMRREERRSEVGKRRNAQDHGPGGIDSGPGPTAGSPEDGGSEDA